jgi:hypothetical protein
MHSDGPGRRRGGGRRIVGAGASRQNNNIRNFKRLGPLEDSDDHDGFRVGLQVQ